VVIPEVRAVLLGVHSVSDAFTVTPDPAEESEQAERASTAAAVAATAAAGRDVANTGDLITERGRFKTSLVIFIRHR
jgi:hypothetical protein